MGGKGGDGGSSQQQPEMMPLKQIADTTVPGTKNYAQQIGAAQPQPQAQGENAVVTMRDPIPFSVAASPGGSTPPNNMSGLGDQLVSGLGSGQTTNLPGTANYNPATDPYLGMVSGMPMQQGSV